MKTSAFAGRLFFSLLLLGTTAPAFAAGLGRALAAQTVADNPARHPSLSMRVVV